MATVLTLPDDLSRQVESHTARAGSDLNDAVANLLRIGLASADKAKSDPMAFEMFHGATEIEATALTEHRSTEKMNP